MTLLTLDTHALIWWATMPEKLSRRARVAIDAADRLGVPTIIFWELALLIRKGKVDIGTSVDVWSVRVLAIPRIDPIPLTPQIAIAADALRMHADPADRFVVASALSNGSRLITKDAAIRKAKVVETLW